MNAVLSVPPSRLAASLVSRNGARTTSKWRRNERSVHSGEWAFSTSDSWDTTPRTVSTVATPAAGMAVGSASSPLHLAGDADRQAEAAGDQVAHRLGGRRARWRRGDVGGQLVDRRRRRGVAIEVEELQRHLHAALAVGDRVVHLLHQRRLAAAQALDDDELPQRPHPVERVVDEQRGDVEQLAHGARLGQGDAPHVVVDVEVGIVDPRRRGEVHRGRLDPPPQPRHGPRRSLHPGSQGVEVRRAVEHRDGAERRREVGILVDPPHQALGVRHLAVVAHRWMIAHRWRADRRPAGAVRSR